MEYFLVMVTTSIMSFAVGFVSLYTNRMFIVGHEVMMDYSLLKLHKAVKFSGAHSNKQQILHA